jgi:hypothetical protein
VNTKRAHCLVRRIKALAARALEVKRSIHVSREAPDRDRLNDTLVKWQSSPIGLAPGWRSL